MDWMENDFQVYSWLAASHKESPMVATRVMGESSHQSRLV
jgi:hypothetical protein